MLKSFRFAPLLIATLWLQPVEASLVTVTFGELSPRAATGVSIDGVTFTLTPSNADATFNYDLGLGDQLYIQDPVLEGDSNAVLTMTFAAPTPVLNFGVGLSLFDPLTPGFTVSLYDASNTLIASTDVNTNTPVLLSEGLFTYSGAPLSRADVSFNAPDQMFAVDNVQFETPTPEPGTWLLLASGGGALWVVWRRKHSCSLESFMTPGASWPAGAAKTSIRAAGPIPAQELR